MESCQGSPDSNVESEDNFPSKKVYRDSDYEGEYDSSDKSLNFDIADRQEVENENAALSYKCAKCKDSFASKV